MSAVVGVVAMLGAVSVACVVLPRASRHLDERERELRGFPASRTPPPQRTHEITSTVRVLTPEESRNHEQQRRGTTHRGVAGIDQSNGTPMQSGGASNR